MADDFASVTNAFLGWFKGRETTLSPKIQLADLSQAGKGRGVVAVTDIAEDEELFSIARKDLLSVDNSDLSSSNDAAHLVAGLDDEWLSLTLVVLYEHLKGTSPNWLPYLSVLPSSFDTLIFWEPSELAELQASAVVNKIGKTSADTLFREQLIPVIRALPDHFPTTSTLSDDDLLSMAHRVGSAIMAYAFDIERQPSTLAPDEEGYVSDEELDFLPKAMVPMADMLNADADLNNARLFYEADRVVMRTIKPVKTGDELFNDYGSLPRADLLRRYGYVTDNYARYDVVEVSAELITDVIKSSKSQDERSGMTDAYLDTIVESLEQRGFYEDAYDISLHAETDESGQEDDTSSASPLLPAGMLMFIYRLTLSPDSSVKPAKKPSAIPQSDMRAVHEAYLAVLRARLAQYPTSAAEDQALLSSGGMASRRHEMAVQVRLGEKKLLYAGMDFAQQQMAALEINGAESRDESDRPQKRQRRT